VGTGELRASRRSPDQLRSSRAGIRRVILGAPVGGERRSLLRVLDLPSRSTPADATRWSIRSLAVASEGSHHDRQNLDGF
jgi:hypothetical protein